MQKHRPTFIAAIAIGLLAGASISVAAQDETADDASMRPALVTGFLSWPEEAQVEDYEETIQDGIRREH